MTIQRMTVSAMLVFVAGVIIGSMVAFLTVATGSENVLGLMTIWFTRLIQFWWPWSLGGGIAAAAIYVALVFPKVRFARKS